MSNWETKNGIKISRVLTTNMPLFVSNGNTTILIDTGRISARNGVLKKLESMLENCDLDLIILTHTHHDHIENLVQILRNYPTKVLVHRSELTYLDIVKNKHNIIVFDEKFDLSDYGIDGYVIHTPGHSAGSSSIVIDNEIAIIGDTLGDFNTKPYAKKRKIVSEVIVNSVQKLISIDCKIYIPTYKKKIYSHDELENFYKRYLDGKIIYE